MDNPRPVPPLPDGICMANVFHPVEPRCRNLATWRSAWLYNIVDGWQWCDEHAPALAYREPLT